MKRPFGMHWLAALGVVNAGQAQLLEAAVAIAKSCGCNLFELACAPINGLTAEETAQAVLAGGINTVSFCRFFPEDGACGDPLGDDTQRGQALETFQHDVAFILDLRKYGLTVNTITGPSCFRVAAQYGLSAVDKRSRLVSFIGDQAATVAGKELTLALEYLRPTEDYAIEGFVPMIHLLQEIANPNVGWHGDVFHMLERREDPCENVRRSGEYLKYLHGHSNLRVAPGAFYLDNIREATDKVNWWLLGQYLDRRGFAGPVVPEPFGEEIRKVAPALGEGLPPAIDPARYYQIAGTHLTKMGLI